MALEFYNYNMTYDELSDWALRAQNKMCALEGMLRALREAVNDTYEMSPEGRVVLKEIDRILEM